MSHGSSSLSIQTVASHAAEYLQRWYVASPDPVSGAREVQVARVLLAGGRGSARVPTCEHTLRWVWSKGGNADPRWEPLLRRALSLFGPGELRALHVGHSKAFSILVSMLNGGAAPTSATQSASGAATPTILSQALTAPLAMSTQIVLPDDVASTVALAERFAASLIDLDFLMLTRDTSAMDRVLSRCARLQSLSVWRYAPPAWLGLSQLHTLRYVDLSVVSLAAIAAAVLPRLHTLHAFCDHRWPILLHGFYETLLPRLRAFHYKGWWPDCHDDAPAAFQPLPGLQELNWKAHDCSDDPIPSEIPYDFMGARLLKLDAHHAVIAEWLAIADDVEGRAATARNGPLSRVRDLTAGFENLDEASYLTQLIRAAPQLRRLGVDVYADFPTTRCLTHPRTPDPALAGLVHPRLRRIAITCEASPRPGSAAADCAATLRQRHFPQLRRLSLDGQEYAVSLTE